MRLRVGVIGVGVMGRNHARVYSGLELCRLIAVSDLDKNAEKIANEYKCSFYTNYKDMLKKERLDAVSICVPTKEHAMVAIDCIKHNIHVLVEKPIADNVEDGRKIISAARDKGLKLSVGHIERYNPAVQELKKIIDKGLLGKIISIIARRVGLFPPRIRDVNILVDLAVHDIDIINYIIGKSPNNICSNTGNALINEREDYAELLLNYNGISAIIQTNWITPIKIRTLNVTGTTGYAELNYITQSLILYKSNYKRVFNDFGDFVLKFGKHSKVRIKVKKQEPLRLEIEDFLDSILNNKPPLVKGEEALNALEIALAASRKDRVQKR